MHPQYVLAIDQGTTGTTIMVFDEQAQVVTKAYQEFTQIYPQPGWVEHDATEIWDGVLSLLHQVLKTPAVMEGQIAAIGITNQRETVVLWDRETGQPVHNAIVWQCRRTAPICDQLRSSGADKIFLEKTGLVLDAYFSGTKIKWIFDNNPHLKERAAKGELAFGTIDSWLIYNLTGREVHVTDYSNASRTLLFNISTLEWDQELLNILDVPAAILPDVKSCSEVYGYVKNMGTDLNGVPVAGSAGDQQAALFGQACFQPGMVKATFGTGAFILMNTGTDMIPSKNGLLSTIAWGIDGKVEYALEGSVFVAGAAVQWLRDELQIVENAAQTEAMALSVSDTNGVYVVPAFVGLGAPYWDPYARGTILGITRGANRNHIVRATLESIVYQTKDVIEVMVGDSQIPIRELKVDGGASENNFICQFLAEQSATQVRRPQISETTAQGAAFLAGLAVGVWSNKEEINALWKAGQTYNRSLPQDKLKELYYRWKKAVERSKGWVNDAES